MAATGGKFEQKKTEGASRACEAFSVPFVSFCSRLSFSFTLSLLLLVPFATAQDAPPAPDIPPVVIDYFYEPGCADCLKVRDRVMPEVRERFEGFYVLNRWDMGVTTNVARLIACQERLGVTKGESVSMCVDCAHFLNGYAAIATGLCARIDMAVAERMAPGWTPPAPIQVPDLPPEDVALTRMRGFTLGAVLVGGLADGVNPCAISTLVFLMSLLGVAKVSGRRLLLVGLSFCLASFATYAAIGFGLLRFLHAFAGFKALRAAVELAMAAALVLLAALSFRDAVRYRRTRDAKSVSLQLPGRVKRWTRAVMRRGLRARRLAAGAFLIGAAVTALESVCTGQVYVPTLMLVARGGQSATAWGYLLAYNAMFVVPLATVFAAAYCGARTEALLAWSRREVVWAKVLLGAFFLAMAGLILWL